MVGRHFNMGHRSNQTGFTLIGILIGVAVLMVGLGMVVQVWHMVMLRQKEQELLFVGHQYRSALANFYRNAGYRFPVSLEEMTGEVNSAPLAARGLRRIYIDPMTGKKNWGLVRGPDSHIIGVYSLALGKPIKQAGFIDQDILFEKSEKYADWKFIYLPPLVPPGVNWDHAPKP